jgi:hypothetical protein
MNKIRRNWRRMRIFANLGMLFQADAWHSSRLVILPDPEESSLSSL